MNFVNLTPHTIVLQDADGNRVEIMPDGTVARVATIETIVSEINGFPVIDRRFGEVIGLPPVCEGVAVIVSAMVLSAVPGRANTFAPDTGATAIRENGLVMAVTRLVKA